MAMLDIMRWQAWVHQYAALIAVLIVWRTGEREDTSALAAARFIVAATYVWSGIHKLQPGFAENIFPWLAGTVAPLSGEPSPAIYVLAFVAASLELVLGAALMVPFSRRVACYGLMLMHLAILYAIGPLGHDVNPVVWLWNAASIAMLFILFAKWTEWPLLPGITRPEWRYWAAVIVFGVLPMLHLVQQLPDHISSSMYTGRHAFAFVHFSDEVRASLPAEITGFIDPDDPYMLPIDRWSNAELRVPTISSRRVFDTVLLALCERTGHPIDMALEIDDLTLTYGDDVMTARVCPEPPVLDPFSRGLNP